MFTPVRLTLREIRLRLKEPFRISSGVSDERRILLIELTDGDGVVGWAECVAGEVPQYSPETVDTAWLAVREWIAPLILGRDFADPASVHQTLVRAFKGHAMAKACVEMAAWALVAERETVALARLLGGTRARVETGISLGIQDEPAALAAKAEAAHAEGYRRIKLKVRPGADIEYVDAVRSALGPDAALTVDANSAYTPTDTERLQQFDAYGLVMLEQPLAEDDLLRHAVLQRRLATPICLDESITGPERAVDMVALGSGRIINIKPGRVGGLTAARAIHDFAADHDMPVWCGGMLETGIGRAHNVALASLANFRLPGDLSPSARYWERDIVTPEWTMTDGALVVPRDRPGLGVRVERDRIDDLTVRVETRGG